LLVQNLNTQNLNENRNHILIFYFFPFFVQCLFVPIFVIFILFYFVAAPVAPVAPQASATPTPAAPSPAVVDNNMAAILAAFAATPLGQQPQQQQQQQQFIQPLIAPLSDVVTEAEVAPLLADPEIVAALLPLLPEGQQTEEELRTTIRTPQFRSTLRTLSSALMSDNVNSIFANFGLNAVDGGDAMAQGNPILAFLQALQAQTDREESSSSKE